LVGVAVKVTDVPLQILAEDADIATAGIMFEFTVMVTVFEVAVVGLAQDKPDVITHDTVFPLAKVPFV
jgi:hypothetical protein